MPTTLLALLALAVVTCAQSALAPIEADDDDQQPSSANPVTQGGLGQHITGGRSLARGFFLGVGFGLPVAVLCCCWVPCLQWRRVRWREAVRGWRDMPDDDIDAVMGRRV
ncbi:hypothetical protein CCM_09425 [Cordyceps militaris CM01]|uniref:Uncharacterized protein n=1 Tax=Cordyceps militaris (strain CM01) TaxID=983644 RepID=G3JU96_CORMM|nr:uncharacterized protein CCM_09425 [Cordyceps militaris CM01]EGX87803.1 hypothetical protein CCM_09425 [Cordyceps militaris CM01]